MQMPLYLVQALTIVTCEEAVDYSTLNGQRI